MRKKNRLESSSSLRIEWAYLHSRPLFRTDGQHSKKKLEMTLTGQSHSRSYYTAYSGFCWSCDGGHLKWEEKNRQASSLSLQIERAYTIVPQFEWTVTNTFNRSSFSILCDYVFSLWSSLSATDLLSEECTSHWDTERWSKTAFTISPLPPPPVLYVAYCMVLTPTPGLPTESELTTAAYKGTAARDFLLLACSNIGSTKKGRSRRLKGLCHEMNIFLEGL
jgi:hypothetical protein